MLGCLKYNRYICNKFYKERLWHTKKTKRHSLLHSHFAQKKWQEDRIDKLMRMLTSFYND